MTPYPHPAVSLAVFKARLSQDIGVVDSTYSLTCDAPIPTDSGLYDPSCQDVAALYNSMVDMVATGALVGEVDQYLYNRLDLAQLQLPAQTFMPYLKGPAQTVVDLLPQINARSGLNLQPQDIEAYAIPQPSDCNCGCGPIAVPLQAAPTSLLYIGQFPLYIQVDDLPLQEAVLQLFLPPVPLPAITP
jgi:hypothetical protein